MSYGSLRARLSVFFEQMEAIYRAIAIAFIIPWRCRSATSRPDVIAVGFTKWKRPWVENFSSSRKVVFVRSRIEFIVANLFLREKVSTYIIWSFKDREYRIARSAFDGRTVQRVEDGFIRSIGRGVDHKYPWSLCVDDVGIYYDATQPSRLEKLCNDFDLSEVDKREDEVRNLITAVVKGGYTKYNIAGTTNDLEKFQKMDDPILVLGQVEGDASITLNHNRVYTNAALLDYVIEENPGRAIIFRQHPDCVGDRHRPGYLPMAAYEGVIESLPSTPLPHLFPLCSKVYTISSLGGFEAALHGKQVATLGRPFYAGWGITDDRLNFPRRKRSLTVSEFFYIAYLVYPIYFDPNTGDKLSLNQVLEVFSEMRSQERP